MFFKKEEIKSFNTKKFNLLIVKICDHHLEITLNRPKKKNALNSEMINELALCTDYANHEDSIRAVIYKSNGNVFCSGLDLIDFKVQFKRFINANQKEIKKIKLNALKKSKNFTIFSHFTNLNKILSSI